MFKKMQTSWALIKASAGVLRADKELILFPILSSIGMLLVTASFAFPLLLTGFFTALIENEGQSQALGYLVGFGFYLVQYTVIIFANSALIGAATIRLRGGDPTVGDGFRIAMQHIGPILGYALISATVGMILRVISDKLDALGEFISSIFGLAWSLASYLVIPILVLEDVGPIEAVKRSANLLKETWGEQIVGNFGLGAIFAPLTILVIVAGGLGIFVAIASESVALIAVVAVMLVLALIFLSLINSTLSGIYTAAVYHYAAGGEVSGFFSEEMVRGAFRPKR
ncbi:MAG: DUF6159 family protein [Anaerolineales bacterium]